MNRQQFWQQLLKLTYNSGNEPEIAQAQAEKLATIALKPTLATELIVRTISQGSIYQLERTNLNFPAISPELPLTANQQIALEMALSNSAIALIAGFPATGKTRIAKNLIQIAVKHQKRVLLLADHRSTLEAHQDLFNYPFLLSQQESYRSWIRQQLKQRCLAEPGMDYLPLYLLPDSVLGQLRKKSKLEKWLPIIEQNSLTTLTEPLQQEFPHLNPSRVQLLAYRLKKLEPLLQEQLKLSQLYDNLSDNAINELAELISENPQMSVVGTVAELMQLPHQSLWETNFDLVIVEEAHYLTWVELMLLSGLGQKLVLLGDKLLEDQRQRRASVPFNNCFTWLEQNLLPAYCCVLNEQFRLHLDIAIPVYEVIADRWIHSQPTRLHYRQPQLKRRLVWQDVPNANVGRTIVNFLEKFDSTLREKIAIVTLENREKHWLAENCLQNFSEVAIGTLEEWAGKERAIALIACVGHPEIVDTQALNILLTRGQDYLIFFGDYDLWLNNNSPLKYLLNRPELCRERPELYTEREVRFS